MIKKYFVLVLILIIFGIGLVNAKSQTITFNYPFNNYSSVYTSVDFSSVLLQISTDRDAVCRYSNNDGVLYSNMNGNFDFTSGRFHEKKLIDLDEGLYTYYIKCLDLTNSSQEPYMFMIKLRVDLLPSAQIILSKSSPLNSGKVGVSLVTSKILSQDPSLTYSFDGVVYNQLPLSGSETNWKSYLIVPNNLGNAILSFKFSGNDLEGRTGDEITSGSVFDVDTVRPNMISNINAVGYNGQIKIDWYYPGDSSEISGYNIYRSLNPGSDYTDFYKFTDKSPFYDNLVDMGKTYYYRISAVDKADNEGDLSKEIYTVPTTLDNATSITSGLDIKYVGKVDNFLIEIDSLLSDINGVSNSLSSKTDKEKAIFSNLKFDKDIEKDKSELSSLKKEVENFKLQNLNLDELTNKLDSSEVKLGIIKKKVPENIVITQEDSSDQEISKADIQGTLLQLDPTISTNDQDASVKDSLKIIADSKVKIKSTLYNIEVSYLDGSKNDFSIVNLDINDELERMENVSFYEVVPKTVAETADELIFKDSGYEVVKSDPIVSFPSDTKNIFYSINKNVDIKTLKESKLILISSKKSNGNSLVTGYFLFDAVKNEYTGVIGGVLIIIFLSFYFIYLKKNKPSELFLTFKLRIRDAKYYLSKDDVRTAEKIYAELKKDYSDLSTKEKEKIYTDIEYIQNKINLNDLKSELIRLDSENISDKVIFDKLEKIYNTIPDKMKKEISLLFNKVKKKIK